MIFYAKSRLPRYTIDAWEQQRNRDSAHGLPTLEQFKSFLEVKAQGRREYEIPDSQGEDNRQGTRSSRTRQSGNQRHFRRENEHFGNRQQSQHNHSGDNVHSDRNPNRQGNWEQSGNQGKSRPAHFRTQRNKEERYQPYHKSQNRSGTNHENALMETNRCP